MHLFGSRYYNNGGKNGCDIFEMGLDHALIKQEYDNSSTVRTVIDGNAQEIDENGFELQ